jgi:hypothetical protein
LAIKQNDSSITDDEDEFTPDYSLALMLIEYANRSASYRPNAMRLLIDVCNIFLTGWIGQIFCRQMSLPFGI